MKERLRGQFQGFLNTPALWYNSGIFQLQQFELPPYTFYEDLDLEVKIPSLSTNHVLGKRIERFFELVIRDSTRYKYNAGNLQIQKEKITLGEIDFLIEDLHRNKKLHIEMVYKFYVYDPNFAKEMDCWIGPNRKDSLSQKINKLKKNQLPLLFRPETEKLLSTYNLQPENLEQLVCYKASLFVPKDLQANIFPYVNNQCIAGYWIHFRDFDQETYGHNQFYAPKKPDWPMHPKHQEEWIDFFQIQKQILTLFQNKKSPLIWMKKVDGEFERFFVVWWNEK